MNTIHPHMMMGRCFRLSNHPVDSLGTPSSPRHPGCQNESSSSHFSHSAESACNRRNARRLSPSCSSDDISPSLLASSHSTCNCWMSLCPSAWLSKWRSHNSRKSVSHVRVLFICGLSTNLSLRRLNGHQPIPFPMLPHP